MGQATLKPVENRLEEPCQDEAEHEGQKDAAHRPEKAGESDEDQDKDDRPVVPPDKRGNEVQRLRCLLCLCKAAASAAGPKTGG